MAVAADAGSNATPVSAAITISMTTLTVGSGANRCLMVGVAFTAAVTGLTCNWDSAGTPQAMTQLSFKQDTSGRQTYLFGLVAPTSGNLTCKADWTNSVDADMWGEAFTNVNQSGGTTTWPTAPTPTSGSGTPMSITIPTASGDATVSHCAVGSAGVSAPTQTQVYLDNTGSLRVGGMYALSTGSSDLHEWTTSIGSNWGMVGQQLVAASSGGPTAAEMVGIFDAQRSGGVIGRVDA